MMTDHYNGGGGETVMSHDSQMLETGAEDVEDLVENQCQG